METFHYQRVKSEKFYNLMLKSTYNPVNYNIFPYILPQPPLVSLDPFRYAWRGSYSWSRRQGEGSEVGHHRVAGHDIQRHSPDLVLMDRMDSNI